MQTDIMFTGGTLIRGYDAYATYNNSGIEMLYVIDGDSPFDNPNSSINNGTGNTSFDQDLGAGNGTAPPINVARFVPRLVGNATTQYTLTVTFDRIYDPDNADLPTGEPQTLTFLRGDVQGDGDVDVFDRMYGSQYLAALRTIDQINPLNMASVRHDSGGDKMSVFDSMFISQHLAALRDAYYN